MNYIYLTYVLIVTYEKIQLTILDFGNAIGAFAQIKNTTTWRFNASQKEVKPGDEVELIFKVTVIDDWYIYSSDIGEDIGPIPTNVTFEENGSFEGHRKFSSGKT